jgi:prolyl-tRNA synthetase
MRAREFIMKDAYSFHDTEDSLETTYQEMAKAYHRILDRCRLEHMMVEADAGVIGGDVNHEFIVFTDEGESEIFNCTCGYTANSERAESAGKPLTSKEPVNEEPSLVETPGQKTIDEVSEFLESDPSHLVKTLLFRSGKQVVAALIPGDRNLNEIKLMKLLGDPEVRTLDDAEILEVTGAPVGFSGPVGLPKDTRIIADVLLDGYDGMIVGANQNDAHLRGVKMGRDFVADEKAAISDVQAGDTCARCGKGELVTRRGVELGHIFKLGIKYSKSMNATYLDRDGKDHEFIMGCYGFGVSRAVAAAVEANHHDKGIVWPRSITPFHAIILPINVSDDHTMEVAESLYSELSGAGFDVLLDDRDLRAGFRFKDADLVGVPLRITLGERNLKQNKIEIYYREEDNSELVDRDAVTGLIETYYTEKPAS